MRAAAMIVFTACAVAFTACARRRGRSGRCASSRPRSPGSATDVAARAVATRVSEIFGQQFIVDNRPGAGGQIAVELAARAAPDGYTLLFASDGPLTISPAMRELPYDARRDLEPVAFVAFNRTCWWFIPPCR